MPERSKLWWVSVGGNDCEPARVLDGKIYTIGCQDGTSVDDPGIRLIRDMTDDAPLTPEGEERARIAWERKRAREEAQGIHHSYRKFP